MAFDLNAFRAGWRFDGARPNLFEVFLTPPGGIAQGNAAGQAMRFFCRSAQLPGSTMGMVSTYYMGREIKLPGNPVYQEWVITLYNDEDFIVRSTLERWMGKLNSHAGNVRSAAFLHSRDYTVNASVVQYSKTGTGVVAGGAAAGLRAGSGADAINRGGATGIRKYKLVGAWPIDIMPIDLDWGMNDTVEEYSVTLAYQWWEVENDLDGTLAAKGISG